MALSNRTPDLLRDGVPPLRVVRRSPEASPPPAADTLGEEFLFGSRTRSTASRKTPRAPRRLVGLLVFCVVVVAALVLHNRGTNKPVTANAGAQVGAAAPVVPQVSSAPAAPTGTPMTVESSNVSPGSSPGTYSATATIRNPTDVTADDITVQITVLDGTGRAVSTQTATIASLASGATSNVEVTGGTGSGALPSGVQITAVAARIESLA
jgi:hypothetical protein